MVFETIYNVFLLHARVMHVRYYCVFLFYFTVVVTPSIIFIETVVFHLLG